MLDRIVFNLEKIAGILNAPGASFSLGQLPSAKDIGRVFLPGDAAISGRQSVCGNQWASRNDKTMAVKVKPSIKAAAMIMLVPMRPPASG